MSRFLFLLIIIDILASTVQGQNIQNNPGSNHGNKFEQLGTILPTPNEYRMASGAPGPKYWQQRCDYDIKCNLDETNLTLTGSETISYFNNSPGTLTFLWLQLDENQHNSIRNSNYQYSTAMPKQLNSVQVDRMEEFSSDNGYGCNIVTVTDALGNSLKYTINKTLMRVELPNILKSGQEFTFNIKWNYKITDRLSYGGRGGYEYFPEDGNYLFTITQWYPRLCVYSDFQGWQNQQFTGQGEFSLTFGNFKVEMTVPDDHIVGSTGECQNYQQVLSPSQRLRWEKSQNSKEPVEIVTLKEAKETERNKSKGKKTWVFRAENVRDFAWTSSRRFVWDAMPAYVEGKKIMCMSYYCKEAYNLYSRFSTKVVAHTIKTYSKFTIPYPYPVAQSVEASNGIEYPMICFNFGRTNKDGTYNEINKYSMIGVIIHEVGHNFFPMIINSNERQWTWMDEGLNSFVEYLTQELYDNKFPFTGKGPARAIVDYMKLPKNKLEPIMSNSENIVGFGANAYNKPATGLNILRETIMGRELFDYAFKEYARRWAFKHPEPADFFRTMEDASGEDLDWFWRGWFFGIEPCDIAIDTVKYFRADLNASVSQGDTFALMKVDKPLTFDFEDISKTRNRQDKSITFLTDQDTTLRDFYWRYDRGLEPYDTATYRVPITSTMEPLDEATRQKFADKHFYEIQIRNKGGLVMPIIIEWTFKDGTKEVDRIPVQIWRTNEQKVSKLFMKNKEAVSLMLDPKYETADIDESNNRYSLIQAPSRFVVFKQKQQTSRQQTINPMQKAQEKKMN